MPKKDNYDEPEEELEMIPVVSSMIAAIGFLDGTLHVEFTSGAEWQYTGVTDGDWEGLRDAPSVGKYFLNNIKGTYSGRKL